MSHSNYWIWFSIQYKHIIHPKFCQISFTYNTGLCWQILLKAPRTNLPINSTKRKTMEKGTIATFQLCTNTSIRYQTNTLYVSTKSMTSFLYPSTADKNRSWPRFLFIVMTALGKNKASLLADTLSNFGFCINATHIHQITQRTQGSNFKTGRKPSSILYMYFLPGVYSLNTCMPDCQSHSFVMQERDNRRICTVLWGMF